MISARVPYGPHVERFAGGLALTLTGELDAYDAPALRTAFAEAAADLDGGAVVLDLTAVTFLDSTALGTIVGLLRRVREGAGSSASSSPRPRRGASSS